MSRKIAALISVSLIALFLFSGVPAANAQEEHMHVEIDIKPGSYPNAINIKNNGVVPVALFGSAVFDVHQVDLATVRLSRMDDHEGGAPVLLSAFKDVNGDGFIDLILQFETQAIGLQPGDTMACLHGMLMNGEHFCGHDSVKVIG